jgi:hypothetical protein
MQLPVWLAQKALSPLAIVLGGEEKDLLSLMLGEGAPPVTVVCDRETAERLCFAAVLDGKPRPSLIVTRGLVKDCEGLIVAAKPRPTLVHATVVSRYLENERERYLTRLRLLAGYETPTALIDILTTERLLRFALRIAERLMVPLVLHDREAVIPRSALMTITVFEYPGAVRRPQAPGGASALPVPGVEEVAAHARFLADGDPVMLTDLHAFLAGEEGRSIFGYWDTRLKWLADQPAASSAVQSARVKLAALRRSLDHAPEAPRLMAS